MKVIEGAGAKGADVVIVAKKSLLPNIYYRLSVLVCFHTQSHYNE